MGLLYDARMRAIDANGAPMSGATLTLYTANTVTPAAIFADAALSVPLTNPTLGADAADAGGWFPQIFAADGTVVDILLKDSGGSTIKSYVDVPIGSDSAQLERTLADDTRFVVRGAGGVVYMEFGNPDPDDIGGTAVIGGWAGTQADLITVNAALFNVTGRLKENGKKSPGFIYTDATTFTAVSEVDMPLTEDPDGCRSWGVEVFDLVHSAATVQLRVRLSYDGGGTFKSGASDYAFDIAYYGATSRDNAAPEIDISTPSLQLVTDRPAWLHMDILTPDSGNYPTIILLRLAAFYIDTNNYPILSNGTGYGLGAYGRATHIRLLPNSGTITGKYRVMTKRGYGET